MRTNDLAGTAVVVTGGAGFIGSHLVDALIHEGASVRVLDNMATGRLENLAHCLSEIEVLEGDIRDPEICQRTCRGVAFVFHQAALGSVPRSLDDPRTTLAVNVQGTANILEAARLNGVRRVIYASSSSVYGDSVLLPKTEGEEGQPLSPYATSKVMTEQLAAIFGRCYGLESVGLRYFNVFGPRQDPEGAYAAVIPRFFRACLKAEPPRVYGDGEQSRDFTFVADAVRANLLAAKAPSESSGRAFNVASGRRTSINDLAAVIGRLTSWSGRPLHDEARPGDVRHSLADLTRVRLALGYEPEYSLLQGLEVGHAYYHGLFAEPASG